MKPLRKIAATAAMALFASLAAAPTALASCPEEPCNAPAPDPAYPVVCVATYQGPIKDVTSCFDPRP